MTPPSWLPIPSPRHERGDDDRDGIDADAAVKGEDALPRDLVDECSSAAQREQQPDDGELERGGAALAGPCVRLWVTRR